RAPAPKAFGGAHSKKPPLALAICSGGVFSGTNATMFQKHRVQFAASLLLWAGWSSLTEQAAHAAKAGVQITTLTNRLRIELNGQLFTEYYFKDVPRPYCYPLIGPGGVAMT